MQLLTANMDIVLSLLTCLQFNISQSNYKQILIYGSPKVTQVCTHFNSLYFIAGLLQYYWDLEIVMQFFFSKVTMEVSK